MIVYRGSYEHPQSVFDRIGQPGSQMLVNEREAPRVWAVMSSTRIESLLGKYWYSDPIEISARSAMRLVVPAA